MSKQTEALKLALEALRDYRRSDDDRVSVAMGILQEALAEDSSGTEQPARCRHRIADARNPVVKSGYLCVDCGALFAAADHTKQPAQEPVCDKDPQGCWSVRCQLGKVCKNTSPQPSKPWVGLVWGELPEDGHNHDFLRGAAWAEAKLREKNA